MSVPDNPYPTGGGTTSPPVPTFTIGHHDDGAPAPERPGPVPIGTSSTISSPGLSPHSPSPTTQNLHPPPNTARTPRRVQWTSDSHIVSMHPVDPAVPTSPRVLDETNIDQVHDALERHRREASISRHYAPSRLSLASSAGETHAGSEEDYDYRLDTGPTGADLEPVNSAGSGEQREEHMIQDILDNGMREQTHTLIPMGETDGLPNLQQTEAADERTAATDIVRQATGGWGRLRRRVRGANAGAAVMNDLLAEKKAAREPEKQQRRRESNDLDEDDGVVRMSRRRPSAMNPPVPHGASVLSALLALQQQRDLPDSADTSAVSSRANSDDEMSDDDRVHAARKSSSASATRAAALLADRQHRPSIASGMVPNIGSPAEGEGVREVDRGGEIINLAEYPELRRSRSASSLTQVKQDSQFTRVMKDAARKIRDRDRPKAARSGAGVFGALMQNTANLSGVATPAASSLTPAPQRPGFQLNRFEIQDEPALPQAARPWRPESRPSSRGGSRPASVHSSTAVSRDEDSPKGGAAPKYTPQDEQFGGKRTRSGLHLDQLGKLPGAAFGSAAKGISNAEKWITGRTPPDRPMDGYFSRTLTGLSMVSVEEDKKRKEREAAKRRRKRAREARKKQEIFIIQHVAAVLARQQFLLKLARALMMFGSPSHRLETQVQATAKVLELNAQVVYLPGIMLVSFGDDATHTSETKFLKQATGLDLGKLLATHNIYWNVVHDKVSVDSASKDLDVLMTTPVYYSWWQMLIIGALCSAFITVIGFYGSFIDALMSMPLGVLLVGIQMLAARNDLFSNVFEIAIATLISFLSAALASTEVFCYTALVSGGVVLILPGYIVLCGALELASRNITAGAVRIGYSVIYSLFLGFGISIGAEIYQKITGKTVTGASDYQCSTTHGGAPWYQSTPSAYWYFLCCPGYSLFLSLRNQQPLFAIELPVMVLVSCAGWTSNHFSAKAFPGRSDLTSAIGSFVVGTLGNIYGRFTNGSSFPVTVTGVLFQLPSGLANGGIFNFAAQSSSGSSDAYSSGFEVAQQLVSVAIGLTVGLFVATVVTHPFGGGRRRGSGIFSF